ncbi:MAG: hypothetical protein JWO86_7842 [Myxococcaceae bacterium]|jgi:hypothetical protein|nr:hypothetical protein [Myxococcaceae bacterium]
MRHAHALALAGAALAVAVASGCSRSYQTGMQPNPGEGYVVETTGATVSRDDPANTNEPELGLEEAANRLAGQICAREVRCEGQREPSSMEQCMSGWRDRARKELASWRCSPAGSRARSKECVASLRTEPCGVDISKRRALCEWTAACPDPDARLVAPGAVLADAGP